MTWKREEIEEIMAEAISGSLDMDWQPSDGARAVLNELEMHGLCVVETWTLIPTWLLLGLLFAAIIL